MYTASLQPWIEATAVPLSGLTPYQALFDHAGLTCPDFSSLESTQSSVKSINDDSVLITGASGCVGLYIVQLAKLAGAHVVAATRSNARNEQILKQFGVDEVLEYGKLTNSAVSFSIVIDTVGGKILKDCWTYVKDYGTVVSIDSASYNFVEEHRRLGVAQGKQNIKAKFFIVSPSNEQFQHLSGAVDAKLLTPFVACVFPLADASLACDASNSPMGRGKIVLAPATSCMDLDQNTRDDTS